MIKEIKMFTLLCDNCGKDVNEDEQYSAWTVIDPSYDIADDKGWCRDDDKHYCPDCYHFNDDDELILDNPITPKP